MYSLECVKVLTLVLVVLKLTFGCSGTCFYSAITLKTDLAAFSRFSCRGRYMSKRITMKAGNALLLSSTCFDSLSSSFSWLFYIFDLSENASEVLAGNSLYEKNVVIRNKFFKKMRLRIRQKSVVCRKNNWLHSEQTSCRRANIFL